MQPVPINTKVCQWLLTGWWFSPGIPFFSTFKIDRHYITEFFFKLALNTINQPTDFIKCWSLSTLIPEQNRILYKKGTTIVKVIKKNFSRPLCPSENHCKQNSPRYPQYYSESCLKQTLNKYGIFINRTLIKSQCKICLLIWPV